MKRDVNFGLLIIIIATIILFSGFAVYYQVSFRNVSQEYESKLAQLTAVTQELKTQRQQLNETYSLRLQAEQDRRELDKKFQDVDTENENLQATNANLQTELTSSRTQLGEKTAELQATANSLAQTQSSLDAANHEINTLNGKVSSLKDDLEDVCQYFIDNSLPIPSEC